MGIQDYRATLRCMGFVEAPGPLGGLWLTHPELPDRFVGVVVDPATCRIDRRATMQALKRRLDQARAARAGRSA